MAIIHAKYVREAAKKLGVFTYDEISNEMKILTYKARTRMKNHVRDFRKRDEIVRLEDGRFEYKGRAKRRTKLDIVWHLVRSHRTFTTEEIERLSGSTLGTVYEYLLCLKALGYLRGGKRTKWHLIKDPGPETPTNTAKCQRLKKVRARKRGK